MAVYDGVPSIRLEGDEDRALALIPEAKALLQNVQTFKDRAGVGTFAMSQNVGDDGVIYVLSAEGQNIIHIAVAPDVPERVNLPEGGEIYATMAPDIYSGNIYDGHIEERVRENEDGTETKYSVCVSFAPTVTCVEQHDEIELSGRQESARLAVTPWAPFEEQLSNLSGRGKPYTQYTKLRPSMYSGKMKKVVQAVMGLGRIGKEKLRDPAAQVADSKYIKDVNSSGVQVRFDWRFTRTHGIYRAPDNVLWLVEISSNRGVIARPLPLFPDSTTVGFYERYVARGDRAMVYLLDELGGLPTGEAFPGTAAQLDDLIATGEVIRLAEAADLSDFYRCSPYSSVMGWAFNERGNEAHNTAYYFGDDGFQRGVWYQININIGAMNQHREPGDPIASGTASLRLINQGYIYCHPAPNGGRARYVPIKFYEPLLPGLMSHEGTPTVDANGLPIPSVDTPMFVSFIDDSLKVVKFYRNPKQDIFNEIDDPRYDGECLYAGSWTITEKSGSRSISTGMYSNDFDDRKVLQEHVKITTITSDDLGYDPPKFSDYLQAPESCHIWRNRVFRQTVVVDNRGGEYVTAAVAIPQFSREAYYYATGRAYNLGRSGTTGVSYPKLKDPNVAYGWRCWPRFSSPPWPDNIGCDRGVCGGSCTSGGTGVHKERRVVCLNYEPYNCSDFADAGPWISKCAVVDSFNQPEPRRTTSDTSWNLGGDAVASLFLMSPGHGGPLQIPVTPSEVFNHWGIPSPDPDTHIVQSIAAEHSALGNDMLVYDTNLSSYTGETKNYGFSPDAFTDADGFPTFVGVNIT